MAQGLYSGRDLCKNGAGRGNAGVWRERRRATPLKNGAIFYLVFPYMHTRITLSCEIARRKVSL